MQCQQLGKTNKTVFFREKKRKTDIRLDLFILNNLFQVTFEYFWCKDI